MIFLGSECFESYYIVSKNKKWKKDIVRKIIKNVWSFQSTFVGYWKKFKNANFNDIQLRIFNRLTDKVGRQKIVKIAIEKNISERTVSRIIKQIKNKIKRLL